MNKAILLVAALLIGWGAYDAHTLAHDMPIRRYFVADLNSAQEASPDEIPMFATAGWADQTFVIACTDCSSAVESDGFLDYFAGQREFVQMLLQVGFTEISCGGEVRRIHIPPPAQPPSGDAARFFPDLEAQ